MEDESHSTLGGEYSSNAAKKVRLTATLAALLADPVLSDVPRNPTLADVETLLSLELGSAMRISVLKMDSTSFDVAVLDTATVKDLKVAVQRKTNEVLQEELGHRHISWRHVWANFCLAHHNDKLLDDNAPLQSLGIRNNSKVSFIPYVVSKESKQHSRRRKHRFFHGLSKQL